MVEEITMALSPIRQLFVIARNSSFICKVRAVDRGFNPGAVDGAMGHNTGAAVGDFQRLIGVPATGAIDDRLIAQLLA